MRILCECYLFRHLLLFDIHMQSRINRFETEMLSLSHVFRATLTNGAERREKNLLKRYMYTVPLKHRCECVRRTLHALHLTIHTVRYGVYYAVPTTCVRVSNRFIISMMSRRYQKDHIALFTLTWSVRLRDRITGCNSPNERKKRQNCYTNLGERKKSHPKTA